jgi:Acetyltransferases, including N-acetylases of ribosomal proteins
MSLQTESRNWVVETDRLVFRYFTLEDLPRLIEHRSDPDVNRYLGGPERQNADVLGKRIQFYMSCYDSHGFGMCPMFWKETGEFVGVAGLQPLENTGEIEVGYSISKPFWGMGIATEAARGWMDHGFNDLGLERIVGVTDLDNAASQHVLKKMGMVFEKNEVHYDIECSFFAVSRTDYFCITR